MSRLARRAQRGDFNEGLQRKLILRPDFADTTAIGNRYKSKRRGPLTISERDDITFRVLVKHEKHAEIAKELRVSTGVIAQVIFKAKKNARFLKALFEKRDEMARRREVIKNHVEALNSRGSIIDNSE